MIEIKPKAISITDIWVALQEEAYFRAYIETVGFDNIQKHSPYKILDSCNKGDDTYTLLFRTHRCNNASGDEFIVTKNSNPDTKFPLKVFGIKFGSKTTDKQILNAAIYWCGLKGIPMPDDEVNALK